MSTMDATALAQKCRDEKRTIRVRELMALLAQLDPDAEVWGWDGEVGCGEALNAALSGQHGKHIFSRGREDAVLKIKAPRSEGPARPRGVPAGPDNKIIILDWF
jgi:hypothetical protein